MIKLVKVVHCLTIFIIITTATKTNSKDFNLFFIVIAIVENYYYFIGLNS